MNETEITTVVDRHFVAPLSDVDFYELKVQSARADLKIKEWVSQAIREKLNKEVQ